MKRNTIETVIGAVVLVVAGIFMAFAYVSADLNTRGGYTVTANFNKVAGLAVGGDVRMSGIKIGSIVSQELDPKSFLAKVTMNIRDDIELPADSAAAISNESLLGGSFLEIIPGGDPDIIKNGGAIEYTQDPVDIVQLLGKFIFSASSSAKKE
ncbi:outer membrane lipid asymmetry maintenance protein MlaD [uncultured Nisaea sp.]|jgi:phospholipid/cholesterol/gamma-HCH transport system substrate-binding protein|uniref:outer membrane lipid asymmetry maintenance protein MlaD n=1 Tax=uncultured Nisaea sp. TaxID=538215 RepID=UPI0030ECF92A|tara:strand:+ start:17170 stop:17628 length:459 start_codon:yes stop_codon:yes gene_type:complete